MAESILHNKKDRTCFLCMMLHGDDGYKDVLHEHHVIHGWANRKLSEKYGLKVYLCLIHHETGKEAVHRNAQVSDMLKCYAQRAFEKKFPEKNFRQIFGRNYILDEIEEKQEKSEPVAGFIPISDGLEGMEWYAKEF